MNDDATTIISPAAAETSALTADQPWPGASPYREVDRAWFFGRKLDTEEVLRLLRRDVLTVLSGPAGVGKTSLVQAGIIPALRDDDALPVVVRLDWSQSVPPTTQADNDTAELPPGALANPLTRQLLNALAAAAQAAGLANPVTQQDDTLWEFFHRKDHRWWSARQRVVTPVFILDQFEEAFIAGQGNATAQRHTEGLFEQLSQLAANRPPTRVAARLESGAENDEAFDFDAVPVRVLLVLREEYSAQLTSLRAHFPALRRSEYRLAAFSRSQARDVLLRASAQRTFFAEGAIDELVAALAATGGVPPAQLSLTASRLATERMENGWPVITSAHFRATPRPPSAVRPASAVKAPSSIIAPPPAAPEPCPDYAAVERRARRNGALAGFFGIAALVLLGAAGFAARELLRAQENTRVAQEAQAAAMEAAEAARIAATPPPLVVPATPKAPDPTPAPKPAPTPEPATPVAVTPRPAAPITPVIPEATPPPPLPTAPQSSLEPAHIDVGAATPKPPAPEVNRAKEQQERDEFIRRQEARERAQREARESAQREAAAQRERERKAAAARVQPQSELKPFTAATPRPLPRVVTPVPKAPSKAPTVIRN